MLDFFKRDGYVQGLLIALFSEVLTAILVLLALHIWKQPVEDSLRWFALCFVPPLLLLRYFAKHKAYPLVTKSVIVVLFVTFVIFMYLMFKFNAISS